MNVPDIPALAAKILSGDRFALSRGITLLESNLEKDRKASIQLLDICQKERIKTQTLNVVISGSPGVGKSTLIESLGRYLIEKGHRIAVLSIDPSSPVSGGSIMGDKTRMSHLSQSPSAYVRPSADQTRSGGLHPATYETSLLCAASGFEIIFIETVGVGQSEVLARHVGDAFILVIQPMMGDELQAIKKGILEVADVIVVNKVDGKLEEEGRQAVQQLKTAMADTSYPDTPVVPASSTEHKGMKEIWNLVSKKYSDPALHKLRMGRDAFWMNQKIKERLLPELKASYQDAWEDAYHNLQKDTANFLLESDKLIKLILKKHSDPNR